MSLTEVLQKIFSECGLVSLLFSIAVIWLVAQLANERKGREQDRSTALQAIDKYSKAYENVVISNARLEGMLYRAPPYQPPPERR